MLSLSYWLRAAARVIRKALYSLRHSVLLIATHTPVGRPPTGTSTPDLRYSLAYGDVQSIQFSSVIAAFEYFAETCPNYTAVEHGEASISYSTLHSQSMSLAVRLRSLGLTSGSRVCLLAERSIPMMVGILAILRSGASYIPLDGGIVTDSTLQTVIDDANPALILCSAKYLARTTGLACKVYELESEIAHLGTAPCKLQPMMSDEAYVIYTSGTTGKPKGVSISHGNLVNLVCTSPGNLDVQPGTRVGSILNIAFDMSVWEIFTALGNGGTLCLRGSGRSGKSCEQFDKVFRSANVIICTPTILDDFDPSLYPQVHTVATAGERCPQELADRWTQAGRRFFNCCGPTEVTIVNTMFEHRTGAALSIGRPTPNNSVYVLDEQLKPLPVGSSGVLWAGGAGISAGYVNLLEMTMSRFLPDPFSLNEKARMYNTGDIGYMDERGYVYHMGRVDDQVKVKGFRVELDGVAASLSTIEGVSSAVVLLIEKELWGVYTTTGPHLRVSPEQIKEGLKPLQPYYTVPSHYLSIDEMPRTSNGKVDKNALRNLIAQQ